MIICALLIVGLATALLILSGGEQREPAENHTLFNTVSKIYSYANDSDEEYEENCNAVWSVLSDYHKQFDIYYEYSGINNLCTVNKNAGGEPIKVSRELIDFLIYTKELYTLTNGELNVMMGSVLSLWHNARENGESIPTDEELSLASEHISIDSLEIDEENCTVRITDKDARIDVGAIGKGYATEKAAEHLESKGVSAYVLDIGGNLRIIGEKPDGSAWSTGIKNPNDPDAEHSSIIYISNTSCVTSGDYERYFTVDGKDYHHIIDKDTLYPSSHFSSVTVVTKNSAMADALSTALFCMSYTEGISLLEKIEGVEVLWIYSDGRMEMTDGFSELTVKK